MSWPNLIDGRAVAEQIHADTARRLAVQGEPAQERMRLVDREALARHRVHDGQDDNAGDRERCSHDRRSTQHGATITARQDAR